MDNNSNGRRAGRKRGMFGNGRIFGYMKQDYRFVVNEEQAEMIRELYSLYATSEYSLKQLEEIFWNKGYRNLNDNKVCRSSMAKIIANPKYKGLILVSRVSSDEVLPPIVSAELWEAANKVLKERGFAVIKRSGIYRRANLLTGKLVCGDCGASFYHRKGKNGKSKWICGGKLKNGSSCEAFTVDEYELKALILEAVTEAEAGAEPETELDAVTVTETDAVMNTTVEAVDKDFVNKYIDKITAIPEQGNTMRLEIRLMSGQTVIKFVKHIVIKRGHVVCEITRTVLYDCVKDGVKGFLSGAARVITAWRGRRDEERTAAHVNMNVNSMTPQIMRALGLNVNGVTSRTPIVDCG